MSKPVVALQLYTVRDFTEKDLVGTLAEVKNMGFDYVELAGTYGKTAAELRPLLDAAGLTAISAHVGLDAFEKDMNGTVETYKSLGCKYIGIPYLGKDRLPGGENWAATKESFQKTLAACKAAGITLMYHNHAHEFDKLPNGDYINDALFAELPEVETEIDTGWVHAVDLCPAEYITKYAGRCPIVHLKDTDKNAKEDRPTGQGTQDMPAITKAAVAGGAKVLVVELDNAVGITSMEAAKQGVEYLKSLGF